MVTKTGWFARRSNTGMASSLITVPGRSVVIETTEPPYQSHLARLTAHECSRRGRSSGCRREWGELNKRGAGEPGCFTNGFRIQSRFTKFISDCLYRLARRKQRQHNAHFEARVLECRSPAADGRRSDDIFAERVILVWLAAALFANKRWYCVGHAANVAQVYLNKSPTLTLKP